MSLHSKELLKTYHNYMLVMFAFVNVSLASVARGITSRSKMPAFGDFTALTSRFVAVANTLLRGGLRDDTKAVFSTKLQGQDVDLEFDVAHNMTSHSDQFTAIERLDTYNCTVQTGISRNFRCNPTLTPIDFAAFTKIIEQANHMKLTDDQVRDMRIPRNSSYTVIMKRIADKADKYNSYLITDQAEVDALIEEYAVSLKFLSQGNNLGRFQYSVDRGTERAQALEESLKIRLEQTLASIRLENDGYGSMGSYTPEAIASHISRQNYTSHGHGYCLVPYEQNFINFYTLRFPTPVNAEENFDVFEAVLQNAPIEDQKYHDASAGTAPWSSLVVGDFADTTKLQVNIYILTFGTRRAILVVANQPLTSITQLKLSNTLRSKCTFQHQLFLSQQLLDEYMTAFANHFTGLVANNYQAGQR